MFSDDPKLGFFAQRSRFSDALDNGEVLAPATSLDGMQQVVTNTTIDGILAAFFALLVIVVIGDATRVCIKALRHPETVTTTEVPYVRSMLVAPAGLLATKEEKYAMSVAAGAGGPEPRGRE